MKLSDDFAGYIRKNQLPCHDQPDSMTGDDFQRIRRGWADSIMAISRALK